MFRSLSIRSKLLVMVLMPMLVAAFFMVSSLWQSFQTVGTLNQAEALERLATSANALVHELQKERGASALFLSSGGKRFRSELSSQRRTTQQMLNDYQQQVLVASDAVDSGQLQAQLNRLNSKLSRLDGIRQGASALSIPTAEAIGFYTALNAELLKLNGLMSTLVDDVPLSNRVSAYLNFLQSKERAGIERAVLSGVFANGQFTPASYQRFVTLLAEQNSYFKVYRSFVHDSLAQQVSSIVSGNAVSEVERIRQLALAQSAAQYPDAADWFRLSTERINKLKEAEDVLAEDVLAYVEQARGDAVSSLVLMLVVAVVSALVTVLVVSMQLRMISRQISSLGQAMSRIREQSDLTSRAESHTQDELGQLAVDFNEMVLALAALATNVGKASRELSGMVSEIHTVSHEVNDEVQSGLLQTDQVAAAVNEMEAAVQDVARNSSSTADQSQAAHTAANEGERLVEQANRNMQTLSQEITQSMDVIQQVAADSEEIGGVLDVINGVAEQTNLLALNAAIEAARAGEQGRGFAVVADEVRTLAQKTAQSTSQIQAMIERLQGRSRQAVSAMTDSQSCATETASSFDDILDQLRNITMQSSQVSDMNLQNAAATEQQSATVDEINGNVADIQQRYHRANDSVARLKSTSDSLDQVAEQLSEDVRRFIV